MEVYIDDMLVKSLRENDHIEHLEECFKVLNMYQMKLNPTKCVRLMPTRRVAIITYMHLM